ncbi:MAG: HAD family hydrolase [Gemmataceae bacterium]|nr:HAD family hydrolase [Gemmataceae bacterium]
MSNRVHPGIRAVFFDAVGTLTHPDPGAVAVYAAAARRRGIDLSPDLIRSRFWAAYRAEEEADRAAGWVTSEAREEARWRRIVAESLPEVSADPSLFPELFGHFARPEAWRVDPDAAGVFAELRTRGKTLGVGSNYDARLLGVAAGHPPLDPAALSYVVSAAVGWRKPGRGFFDAVVREAGCDPGEILFVGDDLDNDYHGATAAGLRAVLLDPRGRHPDIPDRIRGLADLV